jgi:hypothetical protein
MIRRHATVSNPHGGMTLVRLAYVLAVLCCLGARTAAATQYDVEVIVFRNLAGRDDGEQWSAETAGGDGFTPSPLQQGLENLPDSQFALNDVAGALHRSGAYQVLAHRLWRQGGYDRREAVPYLLHADGAGVSSELDGSITLIRERYLHLAVDLSLGPPGSRYRLDETRRIRFGELHYFDSPRLGVIARVTPYGSNDEEPENSAGAGDSSTVPDEESDTSAEPAPETPPD